MSAPRRFMAGPILRAALLSLCVAGGLVPLTAVAQSAAPVCATANDESIYPPWQHGANNDATDRGVEFTVPDADDLADFHGNPGQALLAIYVGGNYFFAMAPLVQAFETRYPQYKARLYWETIPPGILVQQIKAGGRITVGNMSWTVKPDVYLAGLQAVRAQIDTGLLSAPAVSYVTNTLTIMVPAGNPAHITSLSDLGKAEVHLAMPNPEFEGIVQQIRASLEKAGGADLVKAVYDTKVHDGTTRLTKIHHRQTPLWLMQCRAEAGVTWKSEAIFQEQIGHPITHIEIPEGENTTGVYAGALVKGAPHEEAGRLWLHFIQSPDSLAIFARYGFKPYVLSAP
jgi:molybdate transport system substrate-binding protein